MVQRVWQVPSKWMRILMVVAVATSCGDPSLEQEEKAESVSSTEKELQGLRSALTLHASFDDGPDAVFSGGDPRLYTAPSYREQAEAVPGLGNPDVEIAQGQGRSGSALAFRKKNTHAIFYRADGNAPVPNGEWSGTISFWLNLDPDHDLEPGFCDPIQLTDDAYNDSAVWVDFTRDDSPRHFRLGVFGDLSSWNPANLPPDENPDFLNRLVAVSRPPFATGRWTHVAITFTALGSAQGGQTRLYLDGRLQGESGGIREPFTWDSERGAIRLGVNYVGLFDDLSLFDRPLQESEIRALGQLPDLSASIVP